MFFLHNLIQTPLFHNQSLKINNPQEISNIRLARKLSVENWQITCGNPVEYMRKRRVNNKNYKNIKIS